MCSPSYPACKAHAPCCIFICGLSGITIIFPHYLIHGTISGNMLLTLKFVFFIFSTTLAWNIFILRRIQRGMITDVRTSSCKVPVILVRFYRFSKNAEISNVIKVYPVRVELFHAGGRTDGHDAVHSHCTQFCERAWNLYEWTIRAGWRRCGTVGMFGRCPLRMLAMTLAALTGLSKCSAVRLGKCRDSFSIRTWPLPSKSLRFVILKGS